MSTPALITALAKTTTLGVVLVAAMASLAGSEWGLDGHDTAFVQFAQDKVTGHGGCNRFRGDYTFDGAKITIGPLFNTRMACPPEIMAKETAFLKILADARLADATHLVLTLKAEDGTVIATMKRRDAD